MKDQKDNNLDKVIAESRRQQEQRGHSYREQALKMYPWVCTHCGREFTRENLRELTVHHKDHNHDNNPPDGSNWELLCIYCHDYEHSKYTDAELYGAGKKQDDAKGTATYKPFEKLKDILEDKK